MRSLLKENLFSLNPHVDTGLAGMWGESVPSPELDHSSRILSQALNAAYDLLARHWKGSGSFLSTSYLEASQNVGTESSFLARLLPIRQREVLYHTHPLIHQESIISGLPQTLEVVVKEGSLDLNGLSDPGYALLKIFQGYKPNYDYHAYSRIDDNEHCMRMVAALLRVGYTDFSADSKPALLSIARTFDRLTNINVWQIGDNLTDGVNVMVLSKDWEERFTKMLNFRIAQTGDVLWNMGGTEIVNDSSFDIPLAMVGQPESLGEWLLHAARAIRVMVIHGIPVERLDVKSFEGSFPDNQDINFEAVVEVVRSLVPAHEHNPDLTAKLIDKLGIGKYLGKAGKHEVEYDMKRAEREWYGGDVAASRVDDKSYSYFSDLADTTSKYMIVNPQDLYRLVPRPGKRDTIEAYLLSQEAISESYLAEAAHVLAYVRRTTNVRHSANLLSEAEEWLLSRAGVQAQPNIV